MKVPLLESPFCRKLAAFSVLTRTFQPLFSFISNTFKIESSLFKISEISLFFLSPCGTQSQTQSSLCLLSFYKFQASFVYLLILILELCSGAETIFSRDGGSTTFWDVLPRASSSPDEAELIELESLNQFQPILRIGLLVAMPIIIMINTALIWIRLYSVLIHFNQMSNKKINARVQKWRAMLDSGLHKDKQLLRSRVYKGIPSSIRMVAWPELVRLRKHIEQRQVDLDYHKLINSFSNNVYEIGLDIPRTFPEQQDSKVLRKSLNNVLKALSIVYPRVGYCQGENFLALRLLQVLEDEQAFWLLHYMFENDIHLRNNFIDPKSIDLHNYIFEQLMQENAPHLLKDIKGKGLHFYTYTIKGFMTLYSNVVSQECFNRIFEIYLIEGWSIIYAVSLVMFQTHEKDIRSSSMQDTHLILGKKIYEINDIDALIASTQKYNITQKKLKQYEVTFKQQLRESTKGKLTQSQLDRRESSNGKIHKFSVQEESVGVVIFQNKGQEVNFDPLYLLKPSK